MGDTESKRKLLDMAQQHYYIQDGKIFLNPTLNQPAREIGEVKNSEDDTVNYFVNRFEQFQEKVNILKQKIEEAENKGSFMMKLVHMKDSLLKLNGIGDFESIWNSLIEQEQSLQVQISHNRDRNVTIKSDIIDKLIPFIESDNWTDDFESVRELQSFWNKTGKAAEKEEEQLTVRFKQHVEQFFKKPIEQLSELQQELVTARTQQYEFIIDDAAKLLKGNLKDNLNEVKELQLKWKELKEVPSHIYEPLLAKYKAIGDEFFTALKAKNNKRPQGPRIDADAEFEKIIAESNELYTIEDLNNGVKKAKTLQFRLKELKRIARKKGFRGEGQLRAAVEYIFEKQYLDYRVRSKFQGYDNYDAERKKKEKISALNYMIQKNEEEIKQIEFNKEKMVFNESNEDFARIFDSRLTTHLRKLKAKQRLLDELKGIK